MTTNIPASYDMDSATKSIPFVIEQYMKHIHTAMPGIVESYDAMTRRASVRPAFPIVYTTGEELDRAVVHNVPVVFPSGGGYSFHFPLEEGEAVLLVYSQRGMANFKLTHEQASPALEGFFSESDAVAIPGFGPLEITRVSAIGVTLQSNDGDDYIHLSNEGITLSSGGEIVLTTDGDIEIIADNVSVTANSFTYNGNDVAVE